MKNDKCIAELKELNRLKALVLNSLKKAPSEGRLRSEMAQGKYPQYYLLLPEEQDSYPNGRYIRKKDINIAKAYCQKEYDRLFLSELIKQERLLKRIIDADNQHNINEIINMISPAKKLLVEPYVMTDEEFINDWKSKTSETSNTYPIESGLVTENGELVRSKSEKMIADKLLLNGILYKYEAPLALKIPTFGRNTVLGTENILYPDFTILNIRTREELYLEHLGMLDNPEYCKRAIEKIEKYEACGIFVGEKLLLTYESSLKPLNMSSLQMLIDKYMI